MKFSASSLNDITKCGYKYYLTKVLGNREPGKRSYNMLQGDIVGATIQYCSLILNRKKHITDEDMAKVLYAMYVKYYYKAGITPDLLPHIREILLEGLSEAAMMSLDELSFAINSSEKYEFKVPGRLKNGSLSTNKKKPPLPLKVVTTLEDIQWFFSPQNSTYRKIQNASKIEIEKYFEIPCGDPYTNSFVGRNPETGEMFEKSEEVQDVITGYLDLRIWQPDGTGEVYELKYVATPYTQELVNILNQAVTYTFVDEQVPVTICDVVHHRLFTAQVTPVVRNLVWQRYLNMRRLIQNAIYIPACGTDPYNDKTRLCGFKTCGGCDFAAFQSQEEDEEVAA